MAYNQIPVDTSKRHGQSLLRATGLLREAIDAVTDVRNKMVACKDGEDYSQLETEFGIPTGKGASAFAQVDTVYANLQDDIPSIEQACDFIG